MVSATGRTLDHHVDRDPLLSPEGATELLRRSGVPVERADPDYVRLKPGAGILVGYRLRGRGPGGDAIELPGYVRALDPARAAAMADKWATMRPAPTPLGPGFRVLADGRSVLFLFPTDARLRMLRTVTDQDKLKRFLGELPGFAERGRRVSGRRSAVAPVRYKPERRYIASVDLAVTDGLQAWRLGAFLRLFPDARGQAIARTAQAVRAAAGAPVVPRPLGSALHGRLFVEERIAGHELLDAVLDGSADGGAVADTLRRLHTTEPPPWLSRRTPGSVVAGLEEGLGTIAGTAPRLRARVGDVLRRLRQTIPGEDATVLLHGDLHLHQVIVGADGPVLVDLERATAGDPLHDLGELLAHLDEVARARPAAVEPVRRFRDDVLSGFLAGGPARTWPDAAVRFHLAAATANRALLPFRRLEPDWTERSEALLDLAAETLGGGP